MPLALSVETNMPPLFLLLQIALNLEKRAALDGESAGFFRSEPADRRERRAFQSANLAAWARE
jgi:hypothetical protein